jgi:hypothetical protein
MKQIIRLVNTAKYKTFRSLITRACLTVIFLITTGCATTLHTQLPEEVRVKVQKVVVIPTESLPEEYFTYKEPPLSEIDPEDEFQDNEFETVPKPLRRIKKVAWFEGWQVSTGARVGVSLLVSANVGRMLMYTPDAPIGIIGTKEKKLEIQTKVSKIFSGRDEQLKAAEKLVSAGNELTELRFELSDTVWSVEEDKKPDYTKLKATGADMALITTVSEAGFIAEKKRNDPITSLFMRLSFDIVNIKEGKLVRSDESIYVGRMRKLSFWLDQDASALEKEIQKAQSITARRVVEKLFLLNELHREKEMQCMLKPFYPKAPQRKLMTARLSLPRVDSLRPTLKWEAFPRKADQREDTKEQIKKIIHITYDLRIWKVVDGYPERLVYEKDIMEKIPYEEEVIIIVEEGDEPEEVTKKVLVVKEELDILLEPSTIYFWTTRAGYKLDGRQRYSRWAYSKVPFEPSILMNPCEMDYIPLANYNRFKTPEE